MIAELIQQLKQSDKKALARSISIVENESEGYEQLLQSLTHSVATPVIGITGPPGSGKSSLVDALIGKLVNDGKKIAILCIDPSSPFNLGAILGDRIRMTNWQNHPNVFVRSLASRGSLGGLSPKIIEITELVKAVGFDLIIIETVGVGQSEIEITGLADVTIVTVVPEAGDEVQTMKAGLMEIADIFVVNKADRPDADLFVKNLQQMLAPSFRNHYNEIPIVKTIAIENFGIDELYKQLLHLLKHTHTKEKKYWLQAEKAWQLIQQKKMKHIDKKEFFAEVKSLMIKNEFQLYVYMKKFE